MKDITDLFSVDKNDPMDKIFIDDNMQLIRRPVSCFFASKDKITSTSNRYVFKDGKWNYEETSQFYNTDKTLLNVINHKPKL
jgi:hypothetical protein